MSIDDIRFEDEFGGIREHIAHEQIGRAVDHSHLLAVMIRLPGDYEPYGYRKRDPGPDTWYADCSAGCRWYVPLEGELKYDWGVCTNPRSHRCGLLTFEHQGCLAFEVADRADTSDQEA